MESRPIIAVDRRFLRALEEADRAAPTMVPVLIEGASGTGKELVAHRIHRRSREGAPRPFVPVNCAALNETLVESELFGHAAGAFTGAIRERRGLFEEARGGTLFLDEIGELPPAIQAKLLRVLQEKEIRRVGETRRRRVDFRLIAATNRDLRREMDEGRFREDLYYRVHVVRIVLPSLSERKGDVVPLAEALLERAERLCGRTFRGIRLDALHFLETYAWPGNVRELENEIVRAVALADEGGWLEPRHFSEAVRLQAGRAAATPMTLQEKLVDMEKTEIVRTLDNTAGNKTRAAKVLGLSRQGLKNKLARYGLQSVIPSR